MTMNTNAEAAKSAGADDVNSDVRKNMPADEALAYSLLIAEATQVKSQATMISEQFFHLQNQASMLSIQASMLDQQASDMLLTAEIYGSSRQQPRPDQEAAERFLRSLFRDVLSIVTDGRMHLCETIDDLPPALNPACRTIALTMTEGLIDLRRCTQELALRLGFSSERWQDLITACHEAGINAVVHAGGGISRVNSDGQATIQVWVEDEGHGIEVERLPRATLERGYSTAGTFGHGMKMMFQGIDRIWLLTRSSGTTIVLEQDRVVPDPTWF